MTLNGLLTHRPSQNKTQIKGSQCTALLFSQCKKAKIKDQGITLCSCTALVLLRLNWAGASPVPQENTLSSSHVYASILISRQRHHVHHHQLLLCLVNIEYDLSTRMVGDNDDDTHIYPPGWLGMARPQFLMRRQDGYQRPQTFYRSFVS